MPTPIDPVRADRQAAKFPKRTLRALFPNGKWNQTKDAFSFPDPRRPRLTIEVRSVDGKMAWRSGGHAGESLVALAVMVLGLPEAEAAWRILRAARKNASSDADARVRPETISAAQVEKPGKPAKPEAPSSKRPADHYYVYDLPCRWYMRALDAGVAAARVALFLLHKRSMEPGIGDTFDVKQSKMAGWGIHSAGKGLVALQKAGLAEFTPGVGRRPTEVTLIGAVRSKKPAKPKPSRR